jgi:hypothetical protein
MANGVSVAGGWESCTGGLSGFLGPKVVKGKLSCHTWIPGWQHIL